MELPKTVCGYDPIQIRDLINAFLDLPTNHTFENGQFKIEKKQFNIELITTHLNIPDNEASSLLAALQSEGWLENSLTPTTKAMALAQYIDRPRISRNEANEIVNEILEWAHETNSKAKARVLIKYIDIYGSYLTDSETLGDIDIFIEFNILDLDDLEPEDMETRDELTEELVSISDYISPSDELQKLALGEVDCRRIFPRSSN